MFGSRDIGQFVTWLAIKGTKKIYFAQKMLKLYFSERESYAE